MVPNNHASGSTEIIGIKPLKLPADYVDQAETIIVGFSSSKKEGCISTSKLRNLMSFTSAIYDQELRRTSNQMSEASLSKVNQMRLRAAYECGRDPNTNAFVEKTKLLQYLKRLAQNPENSRQEALDFARYMEALVAYHRFYHLDKEEKE